MHQQEVKINSSGLSTFSFSILKEWKELLYFFTWRDIKVKYKQTYLGIFWVVLQPLLLMALFYFVFSAQLNLDVGMSYPVHALSGLVLWSLYSASISGSSDSLLNNAAIIKKIYFPRILLPLSAVCTALIDFAITLSVLIITLVIVQQPVSWWILLFFPLAICITVIAAFAAGVLLSSLNIKYRDFRYVLPFTIQLLFFSSQIVYSLQMIKQDWLRWLLFCNPLNGALELFYAPMNNLHIDVIGVAISTGFTFCLLGIAFTNFKKTETYFADLI